MRPCVTSSGFRSRPRNALVLPEALIQFVDTVLVFDHFKHVIKVVSHVRLDGDGDDAVETAYRAAQARIDETVERLASGAPPLPVDAPAEASGTVESNIERDAYTADVRRIIEYIVAGDVIQCVYSQRFSRRTFVHSIQRVSHAPHGKSLALHLLPRDGRPSDCWYVARATSRR